MNLTAYHAKYYAHELTKRCSSDSIEKLSATLHDAQVDLNPHQIEAALFAFRSPLSKGAILADEVGLGRTIEAGIVIAQKWAERKRKILIIVPSNLRKQWNQELLEKFFSFGKIILFNGTNTDPESQEIYKKWLEKHTGTEKVTDRKQQICGQPWLIISGMKRQL